jgi:hypothetical protein
MVGPNTALKREEGGYRILCVFNAIGIISDLVFFRISQGDNPFYTLIFGSVFTLGQFVFSWIPTLVYLVRNFSRLSQRSKIILCGLALGSFILSIIGIWLTFTDNRRWC